MDFLNGIKAAFNDRVEIGSLLGSWLDKDGNVHNHMVPRTGSFRLRWGSCHACDKAWETEQQSDPGVQSRPLPLPILVEVPTPPAPAPVETTEGDPAPIDLYL